MVTANIATHIQFNLYQCSLIIPFSSPTQAAVQPDEQPSNADARQLQHKIFLLSKLL